MISIEDVLNAADAIDADGKPPTYKDIRARLGSGSYSTIKKGLDRWKPPERFVSDAYGPPPPAVSERATHLTGMVWNLASAAAEERWNARSAAAKAEEQQMDERCNELAAAVDEREVRIVGLTAELATRDDQLNAEKKLAGEQLIALTSAQAEVKLLKAMVMKLTNSFETAIAGRKPKKNAAAKKDAAPVDPKVSKAA